jgi:hypothetical protein
MFASPSLMLSEVAFFMPGGSTQRADVSALQALVAVFFVVRWLTPPAEDVPGFQPQRQFATSEHVSEREIYGGIGKPRNRNPSLTRRVGMF